MSRAGTLLLTLGAALVCLYPAHADSLSADRRREILNDALTAYDEATEAARDNPGEAESLYRKAAAHFETLREAGLRNAALEHNLGNSYYRLGDIGRAVACYRRAQRLSPGHEDSAANLEFVRRRVKPEIQPGDQQRLIERLLFWQYSTSLSQRFWAAMVFGLLGWCGLTVWVFRRRSWLATVSLGCVVLGFANAGLVAWEIHEQQTRPAAVVVRGEPMLRTGRGEGFDPVRQEPLGPGVELRILDERGGWARVQLADQQTGWLPLSALERI
jgi:tetratricopeptide (TPR) repeat protein